MTRQLRPRKSRPSYASMAGLGSDEENEPSQAGPSTVPPVEDGHSSGSDFEPDKHVNVQDEDQDAEGEDDDMLEPDEAVEEVKEMPPVSAKAKKPSAKAKGKAKAKSETPAQPPVGPPTAKRQMYALPTPSVHHRHRAVPLYSRPGRVERLTSRPPVFGASPSALTNGLTENPKISDRVNKSWGYNTGSGPLWDLVEDRGWFKEAILTGDDTHSEAKRRPRVYQGVRVLGGLEILSLE